MAARGGDDVWVEIRRRKVSDDDQVPDDFFAAAPHVEAAGAEPADLSQTNTDELQRPATGDYTDIDDVGPLGHPGRLEDVGRGGTDGEGEGEVAIDLGNLDVPDAAQLFETPAVAVARVAEKLVKVVAAPELATSIPGCAGSTCAT